MNRTYLITGLLTFLAVSLLVVLIGPERIKTAVVGGGTSGDQVWCVHKDDAKKVQVALYTCEDEKVKKHCKPNGKIFKLGGADLREGYCVECLNNDQCTNTAKPHCAEDGCYECGEDKHCLDKKHPSYDPKNRACKSSYRVVAGAYYERPDHNTCAPCTKDEHCSVTPGTPRCCAEDACGGGLGLKNTCVKECQKDSDCKAGEECHSTLWINFCVPKKNETISEDSTDLIELAKNYASTLVSL